MAVAIAATTKMPVTFPQIDFAPQRHPAEVWYPGFNA